MYGFIRKSISIIFFLTKVIYNHNRVGYYLRDLLVSLGPIYVKVGQHLGYYHDKLSPLLDLQESIPFDIDISSTKYIVDILQELHTKHNIELINNTPIANASISVVLLAKYKNQQVILKIRKQDVIKNMESDIRFINIITSLLLYMLKLKNLKEITRKCIDNFKIQLNFKNEYKNWTEYYINCINDDQIIIPKMYLECCTEDVIVMEYIEGTHLTDITDEKEKKACASLLYQHFITNLNKNNSIHCDLHCGNIRYYNNNIILYDFGFVDKMSQKDKNLIVKLFTKYNFDDNSAASLLKLFFCNVPEEQDEYQALVKDFFKIINNTSMNILSINTMTLQFQKLIKEYNMTNNIGYFNFHQGFIALYGSINLLNNTSVFLEQQQHIKDVSSMIIDFLLQHAKHNS